MEIDPRRHKFNFQRVGPQTVKTERITYTVKENEAGNKVLVQNSKVVEQQVWDLYFPLGHSIRVTEQELVRMGFDKEPTVIDIETGETVMSPALMQMLGNYQQPVPASVSAATK